METPCTLFEEPCSRRRIRIDAGEVIHRRIPFIGVLQSLIFCRAPWISRQTL
jgi:hypothetical protein